METTTSNPIIEVSDRQSSKLCVTETSSRYSTGFLTSKPYQNFLITNMHKVASDEIRSDNFSSNLFSIANFVFFELRDLQGSAIVIISGST